MQFSSTRIKELSGIKEISEEQLEADFKELFALIDEYESSQLLEYIASLDLQQLDEGFWGNVKDAAKGAAAVARDTAKTVADKVKTKAGEVSTKYKQYVEKAKDDRERQFVAKLLATVDKDITSYIEKIENMSKKEFGKIIPAIQLLTLSLTKYKD